jgi:DUF1680 family protein
VNRRHFFKGATLLSLASQVEHLSAGSFGANITAARAAKTATQGPLRDRFQLTLDRVLQGTSPSYSEEFVLADVRPTPERRFTEYSGDVSGRYIGALATAARIYGTEVPNLDPLVEKVIALQKPDGYFGSTFHYEKPTDADMALLWGNGRLLVGLLEYYQLRQSPQVLSSAKRLGEFLVRVSPLMLSKQIRDDFGAQHFASSYICWTQQTEGLAKLYAVTHDDRYRQLAENIAAVIERRPGDHVHGYLTSLRGVMDLHATTANPQLLRQCEAAWQNITTSRDLLITGGVPEGWSPNNHRTEGCGEVDWVRLNLQLWNATGNPKYQSMAERAIFNELAFNQYATGDFGHRVYTETGFPAAGAVRAWWCCSLHGLRCFPDIQSSVFSSGNQGLRYDLPLDGQIETASLSAVAESSLATDGIVRIRITHAEKVQTIIGIRQPEWADNLEIHLNGQPVESQQKDGLVGVNRAWTAGDVLQIRYEMRLKAMPAGENRIAFWYGPWLLGAPASDNPNYFNEMTIENKLLGEGKPAQSSARHPGGQFSVPVAATIFRCTNAEYPDQPSTVELRAIAEQAGQSTTSWELRFKPQNPAAS